MSERVAQSAEEWFEIGCPPETEFAEEESDDDSEHLFIDCPNCGAIGFHYAGVYQTDDGQYDNVWYCPFCDYTETT